MFSIIRPTPTQCDVRMKIAEGPNHHAVPPYTLSRPHKNDTHGSLGHGSRGDQYEVFATLRGDDAVHVQ